MIPFIFENVQNALFNNDSLNPAYKEILIDILSEISPFMSKLPIEQNQWNIFFNSLYNKLSNEQKYFYIEHINKLDYNIAYKMFVVSMKIIENWSKEKKLKSKYPIVFPIVIYSGEEEWDIVKNQNRLKIRYTTYERSSINLAYNIVNIKDIKFKFTK